MKGLIMSYLFEEHEQLVSKFLKFYENLDETDEDDAFSIFFSKLSLQDLAELLAFYLSCTDFSFDEDGNLNFLDFEEKTKEDFLSQI